MDEILIANMSTLVDDDTVSRWAHAINTQLREHIAPAWRREPMHVRFASPVEEQSAIDMSKSYVIALFDQADQQGALGWHDVSPTGDPYGRVFIQDCIDAGVDPSTCVSHEVAEAFVDPDCNIMADVPGQGVEVALEVGDPVESSSYHIDLQHGDNGEHYAVAVSNFVYPDWFDANAPGDSVFDHMRQLTAPFTLASGGYAIVRVVDADYASVWGQIPEAKLLTKLEPASRSNRLGLGVALRAWNDAAEKAAEEGSGTSPEQSADDTPRGTGIEENEAQTEADMALQEEAEMGADEQAWNNEEATPSSVHPEGFVARYDGENYEQYVSRAKAWNRQIPTPRQVTPVDEMAWWGLEIAPRP